MKKISLQFHCLEEELYELTKNWHEQHGLRLVIMQYFPKFSVAHLNDIDKIKGELNSLGNGTHKFIVFSLSELNLISTKPRDFHAKNPNILILQVGTQTEESLFESWLCTTIHINDELSYKLWQKLTKELKKLLSSGAWAGNSVNGAIEYYRDIKYTEKAKNAQKEGFSILPHKGKIYYDLLKGKPQ